ncbi:lysozyme [Serratia symbiotica]|uniref:lysozyme n=1 Tax=Serratia symbiotica TaxID=138074 RepID=UPI001D5AD451|nr:lysozyme [Serratia symbiotica]NIG88688.1 lysozyme [Serratia symbiotica]USS95781.1 lysozyme [Serratia symbiotica]
MKTSQVGKDLIRQYEGLKLTAYKCSAGKDTIGYGHIHGVKPGDYITKAQADAFLDADLAVFELTVNTAIKRPMNQHQFDTMVALAFNIGGAAFAGSTLVKVFNTGDTQGATKEFPRWCHCGGDVLPGLVKRRAAEREMFLL